MKIAPTHYVIGLHGHVIATFASLAAASSYAAELNATLPANHDEREKEWAQQARIAFVPSRFFVTQVKDF